MIAGEEAAPIKNLLSGDKKIVKKQKTILSISILLIAFACRKPFEPAVIKVDYNYLVIDGVINAGTNAVTVINLSRTKNLNDSLAPKPELAAQVMIQTEGGANYLLTPQGNGAYASAALNLNVAGKYRLKITTSNGNVYESDYVPVKQTPAIDSLSWKQDSVNKDVTIFAHTRDLRNSTRYYRWDYIETWQYRAAIEASWGLNGRTIYFIPVNDPVLQQYNCWGTIYSPTVATASSEALNQDVISYAPVNKILHNAEKLMVRYSINVRQYGLTKEAYQYWQIIEKSTQRTGTIFDPQPAQVVGNIRCVTNPSEPVIGYASVSSVTEKRIFIDHNEVNDWFFKPSGVVCVQISTFQNQANYLLYDYADTSFAPNYYVTPGTMIVTKKDCLDCRRRGGTNIKPTFWR